MRYESTVEEEFRRFLIRAIIHLVYVFKLSKERVLSLDEVNQRLRELEEMGPLPVVRRKKMARLEYARP